MHNVSFGGDAFEKTPLGQATRQAIEQAVAFVLTASRPVAWTGRVVEANGDQVFVDAGADAGLRPGDRFMVSTVARQLTDPASGAVLGVIEAPLGEVVVVSVQPACSIAQMAAPFQTNAATWSNRRRGKYRSGSASRASGSAAGPARSRRKA